MSMTLLLRRLALAAALGLSAGTLAACDDNDTASERVGETMEDAGDAVEDAADNAADAVEDAGDEVREDVR